MGKKSKDKKKGKGAEKTLAKTEKKLSNKMKKELQAIGEVNCDICNTYIFFSQYLLCFRMILKALLPKLKKRKKRDCKLQRLL